LTPHCETESKPGTLDDVPAAAPRPAALTPRALIAVFALVAFLWGSMYLVTKRALLGLDPLQLTAVRYSLVGLVMLPLALRYRQTLRLRTLRALVVVALFGTLIPVLLTSAATLSLPSSLVGMITALTPVMTALVGMLALKKKASRAELTAIAIGLAGAALLMFTRTGGRFEWQFGCQVPIAAAPGAACASAPAAWLVLAATVSWGFAAQWLRATLAGESPAGVAAWTMLLLVPVSLVLALGSGVPARLASPQLLAVLPWLAALVLGSALAIWGYNTLNVAGSASLATSVTYAVPIVALAWGLLDGEPIGPAQLAGIGLVLLALRVLLRSR
jgi:drug/metabolite transporter (DMT)-like permease